MGLGKGNFSIFALYKIGIYLILSAQLRIQSNWSLMNFKCPVVNTLIKDQYMRGRHFVGLEVVYACAIYLYESVCNKEWRL